MTSLFPKLGITQTAEAMVSIRRLQQFMMYDEIEKTDKSTESVINGKENSNNSKNIVDAGITDSVKKEKVDQEKKDQQVQRDENDHGDQNEYMISIENASAKWLDYEKEDTLQNITIKIRPGELIAVVGQVGSGKSSLMNVVLKELPLRTGTIKVCAIYFSNPLKLVKFI